MHLPRLYQGPIRQLGFTLGEVVATLGVLGVSLSLVVPSLSSLSQSNLRASGINELAATLHVARTEAITRNQAMVVCPSEDGERCAPVAWEAGWIRFADGNGNFRVDGPERVLGASPPQRGLRIETEAFGAGLGYAPSGRVSSATGRYTAGDFTICPAANPADARVLAVSALGYPVLAERHPDGVDPDCQSG